MSLFAIVVYCASSQGIVSATNRVRQQNGKGALEGSTLLNAVASTYASGLSAANQLTHNLNGESFQTRLGRYGLSTCAENIAMNPSSSDSEIANQWYTSAGHRVNMLGNYKYTGVGVSGQYYVALYCNGLPSSVPAQTFKAAPSALPSSALPSKVASLLPQTVKPVAPKAKVEPKVQVKAEPKITYSTKSVEKETKPLPKKLDKPYSATETESAYESSSSALNMVLSIVFMTYF